MILSVRQRISSVLLAALLMPCAGSGAVPKTVSSPIPRLLSAPGARAISLPYPAVENRPFTVRVEWRLPAAVDSSTLHVELKGTGVEVLSSRTMPIHRSGTATVSLTAPPLTTTPTVQIAVWMGSDWRSPLTPIWFSEAIPVESQPEEVRSEALRSVWRESARRLFQQNAGYTSQLTAALLDDSSLSVPGHREAGAAARALRSAGFHVMPIDAAMVVNPFVLNVSRIGLLVLTDAGRLPASLGTPLEAYLHDGGRLAVLGAPAWRDAVESVSLGREAARFLGRRPGLAWVDTAAYDAAAGHVPAEHVLSAFASGSLAGWTENLNPGAGPGRYTLEKNAGQPVLHAVVPNLSGWDTYASPRLRSPFGPGHSLTSFRARGDIATPGISVEWDEKDGSRWIATVPITTHWATYSLSPAAFHFWPSVPGRGIGLDRFHPENAERVAIGLAYSHTGPAPGRHEWWISSFGTARNPLGDFRRPAPPSIPPADGLFPTYRFYQAHDVARFVRTDAGPGAAFAAGAEDVYSLQPRPTGDGFQRRRPWRFIPLLEARGPRGEWRGIPAAMVLHTDDEYQGGIWLSCAMRDPAFYETPAGMRFLADQFSAIKRGVFLQEAGSNFATYFSGQPVTLGARIVNLSTAPATAVLRIRVVETAGAVPLDRQWSVRLKPGESVSREAPWHPTRGPDARGVLGQVQTTLRSRGSTDALSNEIGVWQPPTQPHWVTVHDGQFWLNGRPWKIHGVNYMPSSGIGQDDPALFEQWLSSQAYDPTIVERDLERIKGMGLNAVSVFQNHEETPNQNLLDLLRRCRNLGLHVDVSLRPGEPLHLAWPAIGDIVRAYRLAENDTVFAYDVAWEPSLGDQKARTEWDPLWREWIVDRYGSVAAAEADWEYPAPRAAGEITNPPTEQLYQDGPWKRMALAYRRFADELVARAYERARLLLGTVDANHSVSFRMTETSNPTDDWAGTLSFDFAGVAPAVDFLAPEGYGRIGGWEQVKPGWFERAYARWAAPQKPMDWKEVGMSVWDLERMEDDPIKLREQATFFEAFYRMMEWSGSSGLFYWWYPGGFRVGENSDFGIINPDGTDRPATAVIRRNAGELLSAPMPPPPDAWITFDPNQRETGIYGIYQDHQAEFWKLAAQGHQPGLRTSGTGTTSADCPAIAVGGTPWTGQNPPQYLDGLIFGPDTSTNLRGTVLVLNTGEATWIPGTGRGAVRLVVRTQDGVEHTVPLPGDLPKLDSAALILPAGRPVQMYLDAVGRGPISDTWTAGSPADPDHLRPAK